MSSLANGLECYYCFENDLLDSSGLGVDLVPAGDELYAAGILGQCLRATSGADTAKVLSLTVTELSLSVWFHFSGVEVIDTTIIVESNTDELLRIELHRLTNRISITPLGGAAVQESSISANEWHHLCVVCGSVVGPSIVSGVYLDGVSIGSSSWVGEVDVTDLSLVVDGAQQIDELGLWSRVLSASERAALYNSGAGLDISGVLGLGSHVCIPATDRSTVTIAATDRSTVTTSAADRSTVTIAGADRSIVTVAAADRSTVTIAATVPEC